jgi:hypothetical protein
LVSPLVITGWEDHTGASDKPYRFLEGQDIADDLNGLLSLYKQGLKINTHMYCFPKANADSALANGLAVVNCGY